MDIHELYQALKQKDRYALSKAITLIESNKTDDQTKASELLNLLLESSEKIQSKRIAITGIPGVGKSTFINSVVKGLSKDERIAVLTIDPSSVISGGSILGDKTRMPDLIGHPNVFIRPSPSKGFLGGIAAYTYRVILLCEAAGFKTIFVETVGVGQSEIEVYKYVDLFLLLTLPRTGDELQSLKKGILEQVHGIVVHKTDLFDPTEIHKKTALLKEILEEQTYNTHPKKFITDFSSTSSKSPQKIIKLCTDFFSDRALILKKRKQNEASIFQDQLKKLWLDQLQNHPDLKALIKAHLHNDPFVRAQKVINALK